MINYDICKWSAVHSRLFESFEIFRLSMNFNETVNRFNESEKLAFFFLSEVSVSTISIHTGVYFKRCLCYNSIKLLEIEVDWTTETLIHTPKYKMTSTFEQ